MTPKKAGRSRPGMISFVLVLSALALLAIPSLAAAKDRNHDRIPDRWEKRHKLSLEANQARLDQDRDHLRNRAEFLAGDDPRDDDSDDDGVIDGEEQAGTIVSFDEETGRLAIDLFGAETVAGFVTNQTEIKCEDDDSVASTSSSGPGNGEEGDDSSGPGNGDDDSSGPSENSGPGSVNSGPGHNGDDDDGDHLCTTAELTPGAAVEEAELELENGKAVFEEVELSGRSAQPQV
jgi:hypothetical protein